MHVSPSPRWTYAYEVSGLLIVLRDYLVQSKNVDSGRRLNGGNGSCFMRFPACWVCFPSFTGGTSASSLRRSTFCYKTASRCTTSSVQVSCSQHFLNLFCNQRIRFVDKLNFIAGPWRRQCRAMSLPVCQCSYTLIQFKGPFRHSRYIKLPLIAKAQMQSDVEHACRKLVQTVVSKRSRPQSATSRDLLSTDDLLGLQLSNHKYNKHSGARPARW